MAETDEIEGETEHRRSSRKAIMLAATAEGRGVAIPVKLRDLSETGALIEGVGLARIGQDVLVRRLGLQMPATIMWTRGSRCGVRFSDQVSVREWISGKKGGVDCDRSRDQSRVDEIQATFREDDVPRTLAPELPVEAIAKKAADDHFDTGLAEELGYVQRLLQMMSDELIVDPIIFNRHAKTLQQFDMANQILGHIATIMRSVDRKQAVEKIGMEDMRARLKRKAVI